MIRQNICFACDEHFDPDFFAEPILSNTVALNYVQSVQKPPFTHIFLTRGLVDSGLFGYSTSKCSPIWINGEPNISTELWTKIREITPQVKSFEIFGYLYAILNCSPFLTKFEPLLIHEYPRIPVDVSSRDFYAMAEVGIELMNLHILNLRSRELEDIDHLFQVIWSDIEFGLATYKFNENSEKLCLMDESNGVQIDVPCSPAMWEYRIGSVNILPNWCKSRRLKVLERNLSKHDFWEFAVVLNSVHRTLEVKAKITEIFNNSDLAKML